MTDDTPDCTRLDDLALITARAEAGEPGRLPPRPAARGAVARLPRGGIETMHACTGKTGQDSYEVAMAETTRGPGGTGEPGTVADDPLITFVLFSVPESARIARWHVAAAFAYHGLSDYADDAKAIVSELVANAIQHASADCAEKIIVLLMRVRNPDAIAVVVKDISPSPPVMREMSADGERGRGLHIIEALSWHWGWSPEEGGKAVFAVLETPPCTPPGAGQGQPIGDLG